MLFLYPANCRTVLLTICAVVLLDLRVVSAARARISSLHSSGLGFDQASKIAARFRGGRINSTKDAVKEEEGESPCTKAVRGVNVSNPLTKRIKEAGLLHFNKEARIDQERSIGFDACATQIFKDVNPVHDLPKMFPDAMALQFAPGAYVGNYTFQTSLYEKGHTYCAAPIAIDEIGVPYNASNGFRYWAIGKDCCEKVGDYVQFTCGGLKVNVFPPPPPNISLNESIALAMAGKPNGTGNASQPVVPEPEPNWAYYGMVPTNPMIVDRFFDVVGMAENTHELKAITELGIKVVYVTNDTNAPYPDWLHLPGMKPPICHVDNICVAPIIGGPRPTPPPPAAPAGAPGAPGSPGFAPAGAPGGAPSGPPPAPPLDPWDPNPPGPTYYAVGRGCCSADRLEPGFGCTPSPLARSGVVLKDKGLRFEWLEGLKKAEAVFNLNSNASEVIFLWWDTASTAAWECHKAYYPWLAEETPPSFAKSVTHASGSGTNYSAPPKYFGCQTSTGWDCKTDADCTSKPDLICHGALRKCICSKKCWVPEHEECLGWRKLSTMVNSTL